MTALAFVDTETTGLDPRRHDVWEIAVIHREDGVETERLWQVRPNLADADPDALELNGYHTRFAVPDGWDAIEISPADGALRLTLPEFLFDMQESLKGTVMVGSNPAFDDAFLKKLLLTNDRRIGWHYRTIDVATLAAGRLYGEAYTLTRQHFEPTYYDRVEALGWRSYELSRAVGIEPPAKGVAHTALGDARWARDVYDAVTGGAK